MHYTAVMVIFVSSVKVHTHRRNLQSPVFSYLGNRFHLWAILVVLTGQNNWWLVSRLAETDLAYFNLKFLVASANVLHFNVNNWQS